MVRRDEPAAEPIRVGVSACILGDEVRYDGGHKLDRFVRDTLGGCFELVKVCPELEYGLGVPREPVRLVCPAQGTSQVRMIAPASGTEHTEGMLAFARERVKALAPLRLCGFIVQQRSPSCGMEGVKVYATVDADTPARAGRGLFTQVLMETYPDMPVEEPGRLDDPERREQFLARVRDYRGR